jgi:serine O-acetyltransferase
MAMATQMRAAESEMWVDSAPGRPVPFWHSLREDVIAHVPPALRPRSRSRWILTGLLVLLRSSGFHLTIVYRVAHTLYYRGGRLGRVLSGLCTWWTRHWYSCSLAPSAKLFGGLIFSHPQGIVVGPGALMGPRGWIFQNVTIGGAPGVEGLPRIGSDARLYAGAVVVGPITLGDDVMVGANAVVHRDVPSKTAVRCPPAEFKPLPARSSDGEAARGGL